MNRRQFVRALAIETAVIGLSRPSSIFSQDSPPQVAITIDDPIIRANPLYSAYEASEAIISSLEDTADVRAALLVCGSKVDSNLGRKILSGWDETGHIIGNHSYSHYYYNSREIDSNTYIHDILRGEEIIRDCTNFRKLFRFPYLKEGDTVEKRDTVRSFLKERGYKIAHVTIDASDWYIDQRMTQRLRKDREADLTPYGEFYKQHVWDRAVYYDILAQQVLGRTVRHTLLLHHNLLNALFLRDLLVMFKGKGWEIIDADVAFEDTVFSAQPDILPAGESIIWAIAKESGKYDDDLRYPGEDGGYEKDKMDALGL
jgi:hypothetical protein